MSTAGYGNHEPSKPGDASNKPADGGTDRPGVDLGGASDKAGTGPQAGTGQQAGARATPDSTGVGPHSGLKDSTSPTLSDDDRRQVATPGDGAGPSGPQGGEVDPGAG